jgi:hypothetical protein
VKLTTHLHLVKNKWNYTSTPLYTITEWGNSAFIYSGDEVIQAGYSKLKSRNFRGTNLLLFGKQPVHESTVKIEARDGQCAGMTLKPVKLKFQHAEGYSSTAEKKFHKIPGYYQEDFEQKDHLPSFPQT